MVDTHRSVSSPHRARSASKAALLALLLLVQLATSLYQLPLNRLVEQRLCREYYRGRDEAPQHFPTITGDGTIDESLCKVDQVQKQLAWILGVMETAWIVGDFIMAIPLGFIAEKYGQGVVLSLNLVPRMFMLAWAPIIGLGFGESLPISAVIAAPFLSFLGGDCVFGSITYSLAAGSTDDYVARATLFGYMSSVSYITNLLGPGLASATMGKVLWLPFVIGISLLLLAIPTISLLPETKISRKRHSQSDGAEEEQRLLSSPLLKAARPADSNTTVPSSQDFRTLLHLTKARLKKIYTMIIRSDPNNNIHQRNLPLLMSSFLLTSLASSDTKLLPQYISKRYSWHFSSVGYLLSCKAVINFILLAFIIPRILKQGNPPLPSPPPLSPSPTRPPNSPAHQQHDEPILENQTIPQYTNPSLLSTATEPSSTRRNISHARTCLAISLLGAVSISFSPTTAFLFPSLAIYALGSALPVFTFSLLKSPYFAASSPSLVQPTSVPSSSSSSNPISILNSEEDVNDERSRSLSGAGSSSTETQLFAIVMMVKTLGSLLGAPVMAALWMRGISLGGAALGIPYLVSAACYAAALVVFAKLTV